MPPPTIANDALWKCLCPSFSSATSLCHFGRGRRLTFPRNGSQRVSKSNALPFTPLRFYNQAAAKPPSNPDSNTSIQSRPASFVPNFTNPEAPSLVHLPTVQLYDTLRDDAVAGKYEEVMKKIKILIKDRQERLNIHMYSAVLRSFTNCEGGTAGKVRKTLEEMTDVGISLDVGACHDILEALAVHPDYLLREEVLEYMRESWFTLTDRGHNMVVAGLLRDRLFEQAIEKIEDMLRQRIVVANWLWDKAIWLLLDYLEIDEAWHLLILRQQSGAKEPSQALWGHFLDIGGKLLHTQSVTSIWSSQVTPDYIKPPTATCLNVLTLAGRNGDVKLATDVFRVLSARNTVFTCHHYEPLLEAYINAHDLNDALTVLSIMAESGIKVDEASVHSLYTFLCKNPSAPMQAFELLQGHESSGRKVPTAAMNACIQATVHLGDLTQAIEFYKALHTVCPTGPNTQTFNILFQGCYKARRKELAMYLVAEMVELKIKPNALTYDRLVLVCCHTNELEDALLYYQEMRSVGYVPRFGTCEALIERAEEAGDRRTRVLLEEMKKCGHTPKRDMERRVASMVVKSEEGNNASATANKLQPTA